jgi:hypothetical protein
MTRNQKIALGCGGAGCLGLIVVTVVSIVAYTMYQRRTAYVDFNSNSNYNSNANVSETESSNSSTSEETISDDSSSSSSMSDDDKHRLFQAAGMSGDNGLTQRVMKKLGFLDGDGTPSEDYQKFANDHFAWAMKNIDFIQTINTPEKARAYVEAHIDD